MKNDVKEIRLSPDIADHDLDIKAKNAEKFLKKGHRVKVSLRFIGRNIKFKEKGDIVILKFASKLTEVGKLQSLPELKGKAMIVWFLPGKAKKEPNV